MLKLADVHAYGSEIGDINRGRVRLAVTAGPVVPEFARQLLVGVPARQELLTVSMSEDDVRGRWAHCELHAAELVVPVANTIRTLGQYSNNDEAIELTGEVKHTAKVWRSRY
jgi:hypothetical protein